MYFDMQILVNFQTNIIKSMQHNAAYSVYLPALVRSDQPIKTHALLGILDFSTVKTKALLITLCNHACRFE